MIKKKKKNIIDLTGSDGNAFALLGYATKLSKEMGLDDKTIQTEMTTGDYENLIKVFDKHFGHFVTLLR